MSARLAALMLAGLALAGARAPQGAGMSKDRPARSTDQPRPRDGNVAIREELDVARRAGTLAAYDLFLARHPRHKLARTARRERAAIAARAP
ncbi:MAG TPA: hypothetical protein VEX35_11155 [Allosphingosinicella sp.]|nr:hypothetical protein [Allosphingosinicella sp.]